MKNSFFSTFLKQTNLEFFLDGITSVMFFLQKHYYIYYMKQNSIFISVLFNIECIRAFSMGLLIVVWDLLHRYFQNKVKSIDHIFPKAIQNYNPSLSKFIQTRSSLLICHQHTVSLALKIKDTRHSLIFFLL